MRRVLLTIVFIIFSLFVWSPEVIATNPLCNHTKVDVRGHMVGQRCLMPGWSSGPGGVTTPCKSGQYPCDPGYVFCEKELGFWLNIAQNFSIGCWPQGRTMGEVKCNPSVIYAETLVPVTWDPVKKCCRPTSIGLDCAPETYKVVGCTDNKYSLKIDNNGQATCEAASFGNWGMYLDTCANNTIGVKTAIGCIPTSDFRETIIFVLKWAYGVTAGVVVVMIILTGYALLTSAGNPDKLNGAKENIVSIFSGVIMVVFSLIILRIVGVDILGLPTFVMP